MIPDWLWWGGGAAGALAIFWFGRKFIGTKWAAIAAAAFALLGAFRGQRAKGAAEQRDRQREADRLAVERANAARQRERENPTDATTDKFNRDNRR